MSLAASTASETLQLKHMYSASPEQVFAAWSDPEALGHWFGPHSHRCKVEQYDFEPGGQYRIRMISTGEDSDCGGDPTQDSVCAGEFIEILAPSRIVMSFTWVENGGDIGDTLLTIEINAAGNGSELILTHERLPDEEMRTAHRSGWEGSLECLEDYLA